MDIKLNVYKDRFCRELDKEVVAPDFSLSLAICEDVINAIGIDTITGINALSDEGKIELFVNLVNNALPFFKDLLKELYGLKEEEIRNTKVTDIAIAILEIAKYSMAQLGKTFSTRKN